MPGETRDTACRALDAALERVCPNAIRDRRKYVARIQDNLLPGISVAQIERHSALARAGNWMTRCGRRGLHPPWQ